MKYRMVLTTVSVGALLGCSAIAPVGAPVAPGTAAAPAPARSGIRSSQGAVTDLEALYREARAAQDAGQTAQAESALLRLLAIEPRHGGALNALGVLRARAGRLDEALRLFDRAVRVAPEAVASRNNRGYALLLAGRLDEAASDLKAALALAPHDTHARGNLARLAQARAAAAPAEVAERSGPQLVAVAPNIYELRDAAAARTPGAAGPMARAADRPAPLAGVRLEVSNGVGVRHLASRVAKRLEQLGLVTARLSNQPGYRQQRTEILYRSGQQDAAYDLSARLPLSPPARLAHLPRTVQVRLILGHDLTEAQLQTWLADESRKMAARSAPGGWVLG